jgi:hypothetical protein
MKNFDNTKLLQLLDEYSKDNRHENYVKVFNELKEGNAFLVIRSDYGDESEGWKITGKDYKIKLEIYVDKGVNVVGAFSSKAALFEWAKKESKCISLSSKVFLEICRTNDIGRIVIDSALPTMYVLIKG